MLFVDLDDFKLVNDALGHAVGDQLLRSVAERVRTCLRVADTAARLGGDEFAVLLEDLSQPADAVVVAERILQALDEPFQVEGQPLFANASIGIAFGSCGELGAGELLRHADIAMYRAKVAGKARYVVFEAAMQEAIRARAELEVDLRQAIQRQELSVHYQPIVHLGSRSICAVEALARWDHPLRGTLSPADFIPVAEQSGLIIPLGRWVLERACRQAVQWQDLFRFDPPLTVSVNLSARQLHQPGVVADVAAALRRSGLDPSRLVLEITESVLMQDSDDTVSRLWELKKSGVRLAIDDFGTGYSSLGYLRRLPVDILKIDKTFVDGLGRPDEGPLGEAVVNLGNTLGLTTVAEGVEGDEQLERLEALGCSLAQGYLFSPPVPPEAAARLLARQSVGMVPVGG